MSPIRCSYNNWKNNMKKPTIVDLFMGSSMRETQKLLSKLEAKKNTTSETTDTYIKDEKVSQTTSDAIMKKMGYAFDPNEFHMGMNVEMEHEDVTKGNIVKTAKIAAAHLKENPKYYTLLKKYVEGKNKSSLNKVDTYMKEDGIPSPALVSPNGSIKGAPKPQDVKRMRKRLNQEK